MNKGNLQNNQKAILILAGKVNLLNYNFKSHEYLFNIGNSLAFQKIKKKLDIDKNTKIYIAISKLNNIQVNSFSSRICDVYRGDDIAYSKYLINSHIINSSLNMKNITILKSNYRWFRERNLSNSIILIFLINAFIYFPLAYIKRLRYLKIC